MPKKDIDYSKMVIYKICCKDLNIKDLYIGCTTNLVKRRCEHKSKCNKDTCKEYNFKVYQFIRDNGGWDNWDVIEVDKCPCLDYEEASKIERYYIETLNATLNKVIPTRTKKEYNESHKNENKERHKVWYDNNKEHVYQKNKNRYEIKKDTISQYMKTYYETKKESIKCECGCVVNNSSLLTHMKTQKHLRLMEKLNAV
jgi:hypothetical protein